MHHLHAVATRAQDALFTVLILVLSPFHWVD